MSSKQVNVEYQYNSNEKSIEWTRVNRNHMQYPKHLHVNSYEQERRILYKHVPTKWKGKEISTHAI